MISSKEDSSRPAVRIGRSLIRALLFFAAFAFTVQLGTGVYGPGLLRGLQPYALAAAAAALAAFLIVNRLITRTRGERYPHVLYGLLAFVLSWLALLFFMSLGPYPPLGYLAVVAAVAVGSYVLDRGLALGVWLAAGAGIVPLARAAASYTPVLSPLQINSIFSGGYTTSAGLTALDVGLATVALVATLPLAVFCWNIAQTRASGNETAAPISTARIYGAAGAVLLASLAMLLAARGVALDSVRVLNHDRHAVREQSVINLAKELKGKYSRDELVADGKAAPGATGLMRDFSRASQQSYFLLLKDNKKNSFRIVFSTLDAPAPAGAKAEIARFITVKEQALAFHQDASEIDLLNIADRSWYSIGGPPSSRTVFPSSDASGTASPAPSNQELVVVSTSPEPFWWRRMQLSRDYLAGALYPAFPILFFIWVLAASLFLLLFQPPKGKYMTPGEYTDNGSDSTAEVTDGQGTIGN